MHPPNDTCDLCSCDIHKQTTFRSLIKLSLNLHAVCCQVPHTFPYTLPDGKVLSSYLQLVLNLFPSLEECETNNWFIEMHNSTVFFDFNLSIPVEEITNITRNIGELRVISYSLRKDSFSFSTISFHTKVSNN